MEGNGGEHNLQRAQAALEQSNAKLECPSCGHNAWVRNRNAVVLKEAQAVEVDEVGVPIGGDLFGGVPAYALICRNCGFMRLHSLQFLLGKTDF